MQKVFKYLFFLTILAISCEKTPDVGGTHEEPGDVRIVWETPQQVTGAGGGYPRVHRLNDGRLMMTYSKSFNGYARFSEDEGKTWPESTLKNPMSKFYESNEKGEALLSVAVPDFAQLSENHPHHPNRIIFAGNYRPRTKDGKTTGMTTIHPYTISISVSDNNGKTWSDTRHIYMSDRWNEDVTIGCWEPFVLELPDGTVQIYFADETPYYRLGSRWHNISVIESKDGGDTWEKVRVVSQNGACRDGMPVVAIHEDRLLLAVESTDYSGERLHPIVIQNTIEDNWKVTVGKGSPYRFEPFQKSLKSEVNYSGSPYIITTDNYIVYSYHIADWWTPPTGLTASQQLAQAKQNNDTNHAALEVQVCPKSEVQDGYFRTMRAASRPLPVDQTTGKENAIWNSLCDLGNDEILAVSQYKSCVYIVKGKIVGPEK